MHCHMGAHKSIHTYACMHLHMTVNFHDIVVHGIYYLQGTVHIITGKQVQ